MMTLRCSLFLALVTAAGKVFDFLKNQSVPPPPKKTVSLKFTTTKNMILEYLRYFKKSVCSKKRKKEKNVQA